MIALNEAAFVRRLHVAAYQQLVRDTKREATATEVSREKWAEAKRTVIAATLCAYDTAAKLDTGEVH